jgi:hypothetical protein
MRVDFPDEHRLKSAGPVRAITSYGGSCFCASTSARYVRRDRIP